ncbi:MAG: DUF559 domain-containing protein [Burkholderiales bacterium]|nr:MAG: DUF559 domain-containing protein [Burkholderiales bacterium]
MRARALRSISTDTERLLWHHLRDRRLGGYKFRRQHPIGPFFADFACVEAGLVIELDGGQHYEAAALDVDARRTAALNAHGFEVLRFNDREVLTECDGVLHRILDWLHARHPHPQPSPAGGRGGQSKDIE